MSEFKVGDWVKSIKYRHLRPIKIQTIYESNTRHGTLGLKSNGIVLYSDEVELWTPQPGEWCWFWKGYPSSEVPQLQQFKELEELGRYTTMQKGCFNHCEQFIGELPTFLKDN